MNRKLSLTGSLLAALAVVVGSSLFASPANAAETATSTGKACWVDYSTDVTQCFADDAAMQAAITAQTGHALIYPTTSPSKSITARALPEAPKAAVNPTGRAVAAGGYALLTIYDNQGWGGDSYTFTDSHSNTCSGYLYNFDSIPNGMDNRTSSFRGWGPCKGVIYDLPGRGGAQLGPIPGTTYVGDAMNDRTSSIAITG